MAAEVKRRSVEMSQFSIEKLLGAQTAKLKACYKTLEQLMPPYFFKSVSAEEL